MANIHDLTKSIKIYQLIAPQSIPAGTTIISGGVGLIGFKNMSLIANIGAFEAGGVLYVNYQVSDDGNTWTAPWGYQGIVTDQEDGEVYVHNIDIDQNMKKYFRVLAAAAVGACIAGLSVIAYKLNNLPIANDDFPEIS